MEQIEEEEAKDSLLKGLIEIHEPEYAESWRGLPEGFRRTMLAGIVGFRIPIARIEGKFKISQNRSAVERRKISEVQSGGNADQQLLAAWMRRFGL
jgi:transcriptional regulator